MAVTASRMHFPSLEKRPNSPSRRYFAGLTCSLWFFLTLHLTSNNVRNFPNSHNPQHIFNLSLFELDHFHPSHHQPQHQSRPQPHLLLALECLSTSKSSARQTRWVASHHALPSTKAYSGIALPPAASPSWRCSLLVPRAAWASHSLQSAGTAMIETAMTAPSRTGFSSTRCPWRGSGQPRRAFTMPLPSSPT